ncbi:hypothetical protein CRUP_004921 [Coryphaenoides rupestris]|nr:hypothetical protein CRUP_004921 [Coryphaenoides rupestris]
MVNIGVRKIDDALVAKHPGLEQYAACQSYAFMKGTGTFLLGTAGFFILQKSLQKRLPYALQWNLLVSFVAASVGSYAVTRWETRRCAELWVLLEKGELPHPPTSPSPTVPTSEDPPGPKTTAYGDVME